ncbi:hypothetical protein, variant 2 [Spizellomyces punctatus DAOM BR117]|uniref:Uncharacterized protein n=1 Tax=Spizellomyces punctatus (strain DAOM BR117) TaxID=645134 RepID=A0A0L0H863_SPIPD|nr:hypothetical protein, variant 2 [Spizellomyces punctatus DAOM BR117]KNC97417.1 hypothetical protein, variant 2 [Spizellomyces punctatus DAOM BR117]|eukprot:XP_016605457.1 hypothetical protein, variant 2 [Spizellomyces punctatus DAOM BR117]
MDTTGIASERIAAQQLNVKTCAPNSKNSSTLLTLSCRNLRNNICADLRKTGRRSQYGKSGRPHAMLSNSLQRQARSNLGRRNKRNGPRRFRGDSYRPAHHSVHDRSSNTVSEEESKSSTATADQSAASDQEVDKLLDEAFAELGLDEDESGDGDESEEDWEAADYSTPPLSQWEYPEASYERDRETFYRIGGTNLNTSFIGSDFPTNFLEDVNSLT